MSGELAFSMVSFIYEKRAVPCVQNIQEGSTMRKTLFFGAAVSLLFSQLVAVAGPGKKLPLLKPTPFVTSSEKLQKAAALDAKFQAVGTSRTQAPSAKRSGGSQASTQQMDIYFADLGRSINPFSVITGGRNYVSVVPQLNTVAMFRRGGGNSDPAGTTGARGNKLVYDISTKGGADGTWQLSKGPLFSDDLFTGAANYDPAGANYGPRYPQGAIWSPANNTDTAQAFAFGITAVLDGSNGTWGGLGTGWQRLQAGATPTTHLFSSPDPMHYISESMEISSNGSIFAVNAERDASGSGVAYTDRITLYRYNYNSATQSFDSTITYLPFSNEGGDYATVVGGTQIAFGNDGLTGYIVVAAANNEFDSTAAFLPYVAKTIDGGNSWSGWAKIAINKHRSEFPSPEKDSFRDSLLIGNYVHFTEAGEIVPTTFDDPTKHPVDYLVNDFKVTVDKDNYVHIFASLAVSGFGDTLNATFPNGVTYYPGYGSWNVDFYLNNVDSVARGIFINKNEGLNGCWGDCAGTENFTEANRPAISRSADGSVICFVWYDTDPIAHEQLTADNNSNPDLWIRTMRVGNPGEFFLNDKPRNITKGTDKDGLAILGNAAPRLVNATNGYTLASTIVGLDDFGGATSPWGTQHVYIGGVTVPSAAQIDSFPRIVGFGPRILSTNPVASAAKQQVKLTVGPNPSTGFFTAHLYNMEAGATSFRVINSVGQVVMEKNLMLGKGESHVPFNIRTLNQGVYTLQVLNGNKVSVQRIVKN